MIAWHLAEVAPLAPSVAYALLTLASAVTFVVCLGLLWSWRRTIGYAFTRIGHISIFGRHPLGFLGSFSNTVEGYLSQAAAASEHAMVYMFHRMIGMIIWAAQETAGLATDVYDAIRGSATTVTHTVTRTLDAKTQALVRKLTVAVGALAHVAIPNLRARVHALERRLAHTAHVAAGAIAAPFPRIGRLERETKAHAKRLTRLEKLLAGGLGVALLLRALSRLGLGWLRCSNVSKVGKSVCKMNPLALEALLLDAAALTVTFNLEEFAEELQTVTGEAARLIHNWSS